MKHLLISYSKQTGRYTVWYNHNQYRISHEKSGNLRHILNNNNPHWRAVVKWCQNDWDSIDMMYQLEKK